MRVVFSDTNIIYGLMLRLINGGSIEHSSLFSFAQHNEVYISDFVLKELQLNIWENEKLILKSHHISEFITISNIRIMRSNILRGEFAPFVNDLQDAQILQDAYDINAQYLLTRNLKDFDILSIESTLNIKVIGSIPIDHLY